MVTFKLRVGAIALAIAGLSLALPSIAQAANEIQQVLETGWKPSADNYAAAQQQYEQNKAAAAGDARAPLAIALVSLKNRKMDDAQKYLAQAIAASGTKLDPTAIAVRRLKIYLDVFRKDATSAQAGMHALAQLLATDDPIAPRPESKQAAEWMGSVIGYLAGPAAEQNFPLKADVVQADVLAVLKGPLANSVNDGKAAALKQYDSLKQQQAAARNELKSSRAAKRADEIKQVEAQKKIVEDKLKKLEDPSASSTATTGLAGTGKKDGKAAAKDSKDAAKIAEEQQQKAQQMEQQAAILTRQIQQERRKARPNNDMIMSWGTQLTLLRQKAMESGFTPDQMQMQQQEDQKKQSVEAERKRLRGQETQLNNKLKQLTSAMDNQNVPTPVDAKIAAINSYASIDLEQEKQRIVASYAAR
jgi:hypothetical protein